MMSLQEQVYECLRVLRFSNDSVQRKQAQQELLELGNDEVVEVLSEIMLSDQDPELQGYAAEGIVKIEPKRGSRIIIPLLGSSDPIIRRWICCLLYNYGDEQATMPLVSLLQNDEDANVRFDAAFALGGIGDRRAIPALQWAQQHDDGVDFDGHPVKVAAANAIQEILTRYPYTDDSDEM